ncbi:MAG: hypothetical protein D6767_04555 [Candidatus Hydrogenedentota bacterium]|nr:MAG: hypothetical protein D6767_04555 [Candidatus Hydrogenedentota bacterium]
MKIWCGGGLFEHPSPFSQKKVREPFFPIFNLISAVLGETPRTAVIQRIFPFDREFLKAAIA